MSVVKTVRQTDGTTIDAIFSDDGKLIKTNIDGGYIIWAPATQDNIDLPVASERTGKRRRAEHDLRKIHERVEILKRREYPLTDPETYLDDDMLREGRRRRREEQRRKHGSC